MNISTDHFIPPVAPERTNAIRLRFDLEGEPPKLKLDEFWEFCSQNRKLFVEMESDGEVRIILARGFEFSQQKIEILVQFFKWSEENKAGVAINSLVCFALPDGSVFSPTFSWINKKAFENLSKDEREKLIHLCPDFVLELHSDSDAIEYLHLKMCKYIENGAKLGWLIYPKDKQVFVYRPNADVEVLNNPEKVSGEPLLTGFELNLRGIW